ncbi:hypothetical protein AC579_9826 [Pseudocercospora musae]|uniref:Uncharacterized protein n=1 Tax=Pseudocercospora musae TaxID=113226 RepID=A0A139IVQ8_9PEZI|nr:hypothetical protein AC579_9826 [Pseudocercospora musae]
MSPVQLQFDWTLVFLQVVERCEEVRGRDVGCTAQENQQQAVQGVLDKVSDAISRKGFRADASPTSMHGALRVAWVRLPLKLTVMVADKSIAWLQWTPMRKLVELGVEGCSSMLTG